MSIAAVPTTATEELEQALGEVSETVTIKSKGKSHAVTVTPFRLRQFSAVLKCVQRMRAAGVIKPDMEKRVLERINKAATRRRRPRASTCSRCSSTAATR
jgi:hypothetical protein